MLLNFTFENWKSFQNQTEFSMLATESKHHEERLIRLNGPRNNQLAVVPIAALYGGNASGKTNFCSAIEFAQKQVVEIIQPDSPIPIEQSLIPVEDKKTLSRFEFTIQVGEDTFQYIFNITNQKVEEEKLTYESLNKEGNQDAHVLFHRRIGKSIDIRNKNANEKNRLEYVFQGTRDNQLFLNNSVTQNIDTYRPVYDWFKYQVRVIDSSAIINDASLYFNNGLDIGPALSDLDTGIAKLQLKDVPPNSMIPAIIATRIKKNLANGESKLLQNQNGDRFIVSNENGNTATKQLIAEHEHSDGESVAIPFSNEASGSQRLIDLLPAFFQLASKRSECVYIIDELDRSLHSNLAYHLIESYLTSCMPKNRSQLIFTAHDVQLMDKNLFRIDELWVTERDATGTTSLNPLSEFGHLDGSGNIKQKYLQGRLGGIPSLFPFLNLQP